VSIEGLRFFVNLACNWRIGWEDSIEITSNISWTPTLPDLFENKTGYSIKKYLPLIMFGNNNGQQALSPGSTQCLLETPDGGEGIVNDFRAALADGYRLYLQALTNWTHFSLGLQMSAQVSDNLPMDMQANIPFVDAPECESLSFGDNIDGYRQYAGAAHLAGKVVISNEMGAEFGKAYSLKIPRLLLSANRAFAGGINQLVLHGQSFTGSYYGTTWPGYTAFSYLFSDSYSNKQPVWDHGLSEALDYFARTQFVLQKGVPKIDVAIYTKVSATNLAFPTLYESTDLLEQGKSAQSVLEESLTEFRLHL
jgi:hypothetical protein